SLAACAAKPADLVIHNVTAIDATNGARSGVDVSVRDGLITAVTTERITRANQHIDGEGLFLIPGLWDMHVHLTYDDRFTPSMPRDFVRYGITSVRDTGGVLPALLPVVARMREPDAIAPRVYFSGPLLDSTPVVYDGDNVPLIGTAVDQANSALTRITELRDAGASFIKIYEMVEPEVFDALAAAANQLDLPIAAHVPLSMLASVAGPRVQSIEHLRNIELDCAAGHETLLQTRRAMLRRARLRDDTAGLKLRQSIHGAQRDDAIDDEADIRCREVLASLAQTIQVPTLRLNAINQHVPMARDDWQTAVDALPESIRENWREPPVWLTTQINPSFFKLGQWSLDMVPKLLAAGVPIGAGTDTPIAYAIPGYSLHNELTILADAGLSPKQALAAATTVPAQFFDLQDVTGTIDVGKHADLVLLSANPLADIENTRRIDTVIVRGRIVSP
ncbi:MAG: amidohydrolase family protein, partial [Pseudomonadota bacterium]